MLKKSQEAGTKYSTLTWKSIDGNRGWWVINDLKNSLNRKFIIIIICSACVVNCAKFKKILDPDDPSIYETVQWAQWTFKGLLLTEGATPSRPRPKLTKRIEVRGI